MIGSAARTWRDQPGAAHPRACTTGCCGCGRDAEVARLAGARLRQQLAAGQPGPGRVGGQARLRPAQPGDLRVRGGAGRRRRAALRRLDHAPAGGGRTSTAAAPATGTCAPGATRSRAVPRRSCATSSPSGCSGCRRRSGWTRTCHGRTCRGEPPRPTGSATSRWAAGGCLTCSTARPRPSCGRRCARCSTTGRPGRRAGQDRDAADLRHRAVADAGRRPRLRRAADPRGQRRRRGVAAARPRWWPRKPGARSPRCLTWAARWSPPPRCWPRADADAADARWPPATATAALAVPFAAAPGREARSRPGPAGRRRRPGDAGRRLPADRHRGRARRRAARRRAAGARRRRARTGCTRCDAARRRGDRSPGGVAGHDQAAVPT